MKYPGEFTTEEISGNLLFECPRCQRYGTKDHFPEDSKIDECFDCIRAINADSGSEFVDSEGAQCG